jgi:hypothetical protein
MSISELVEAKIKGSICEKCICITSSGYCRWLSIIPNQKKECAVFFEDVEKEKNDERCIV